MTTERRRFIVKAGGGMAAVATAAIVDAPNVIAQPKVQWRMSTAYPPALDRQQAAGLRLAKAVDEMSGGRFRIEVFPGGQIMEPLTCFDAASRGTIEAFYAAPLFWAERETATQWFSTVPFGMNCEGSSRCEEGSVMTERRGFIATAGGVHGQQLDVSGDGASESDFVVSVQAGVIFAGICKVGGARGAATASVATF